MLWIESRRYRFYDAFRARVRMLEAHFLVPMVMENRQMLQGEWKKLVCEDLILPSFKISKLEAIGRRLKRNYIFIFILIMVAWVTKIFLHAPVPMTSLHAFYGALRIGHIPAWLIAFVFVGTLVSVIGITIYVSKKSSGEIAEQLRAPGGCPWDREQTHESLLPKLIEEAYEVAEAVHKNDVANFREELGDLLLHVVMHAEIARETGQFKIEDILTEVTEKLVRRHPHVFGTSDVRDSGGVVRQWEAIKREEKKDIHADYRDGRPRALPALIRE